MSTVEQSRTLKDMPASDLFRELDKDFVNLERITDDVFTYKATDVLVQSQWEIPIIIQWPKSSVSFEFSSEYGDLDFSILFVAALDPEQPESELDVETLEDLGRTSSGTELIEGTFDVPCEGVLFFVWDNKFDWISNKQLSYAITVKQPQFAILDEERVQKVKPILLDVLSEIETSSIRLADAEDYIIYQGNNVMQLERQIQELEEALFHQKQEIESLTAEKSECQQIVESFHHNVSGVGLRCLNVHLLALILSYLPLRNPPSCVGLVNKYWLQAAGYSRKKPYSSTEAVVACRQLKHYEESLGDKSGGITKGADALHRSNDSLCNNASPTNSQLEQQHQQQQLQQQQQQQQQTSKAGGQRRPSGNSLLSASLANLSTDAKGQLQGPQRSPRSTPGTGQSGTGKLRHFTFDKVGGGAPEKNVGSTLVKEATSPNADRLKQLRAQEQDLGKQQQRQQQAQQSRQPTEQLPEETEQERLVRLERLKNLAVPRVAEGKNSGGRRPLTGAGGGGAAVARRPRAGQRIGEWRDPSLPQGKEGGAVEGTAVEEPMGNTVGEENNATGGDLIVGAGSTTGPATATAAGAAAARQPPSRRAANEAEMLRHAKQLKTQQQLFSLIDYVQAGYMKIEALELEKRRLKKVLRTWNANFEKEHNRQPTTKERKAAMRDVYLEYEQVSDAVTQRKEKIEGVLNSVGITHSDFIRLRDRRTAEWMSNAKSSPHGGAGALNSEKIRQQYHSLISPGGGGSSTGGGGGAANAFSQSPPTTEKST